MSKKSASQVKIKRPNKQEVESNKDRFDLDGMTREEFFKSNKKIQLETIKTQLDNTGRPDSVMSIYSNVIPRIQDIEIAFEYTKLIVKERINTLKEIIKIIETFKFEDFCVDPTEFTDYFADMVDRDPDSVTESLNKLFVESTKYEDVSAIARWSIDLNSKIYGNWKLENEDK